MAFVHKSARRFTQKTTTHAKIGPGTYVGQHEYDPPANMVPFLCSSIRKDPKPEEIPGPGAYNVSNEYQQEKIITTNLKMDIKIVEVPKPSSIFKSSTQRWDESQSKSGKLPGPGHYNYTDDINKISYKYNNQKNYGNVLFDEFKKQASQIKIPSIPTSQQRLGYSENENKSLELNKNTYVKHKGVREDQVGPGDYEIKEKWNTHKGTNFHKSKSLKMRSMQANSFQIGPEFPMGKLGSYNPSISIKAAYHNKQTSSFLTKSQRLFDIRKGAIANKNLLEKLEEQSKYSQHSTNVSRNLQSSIEDEIEYIEDSTPGPGYYFNEKLSTSFASQKLVKGLKKPVATNRFSDLRKTNPEVGPGKYEVTQNLLHSQKNKPKNQAPFLISDLRFREEVKVDVPGPGTYEHPKTLENDLIRKAKFGYQGNFSTKEKRFTIEELTNEIPGPGEYIPLNQFDHKNELTHNFKSTTVRQLFQDKKEKIPNFNTYDVNNFNLAVTAQKGVETDPELAKKIPQFNRSEPRFLELLKMEKAEAMKEPAESIILKEKTLESLLKINPENQVPFNSGANRFIYTIKEETPGPGTYDDMTKVDWSKRSYNVAFAEI